MNVHERLLKYVTIKTPSDEYSETVPSSACQFDLARYLHQELLDLGITDVTVDDQCYLYAHLPASPGYENRPTLGFIAHMDTVSEFCEQDIRPQIHTNYDGQDLPLGTSGRTLSANMFPHLKSLTGRTLITTDGTTILGADDKAGIAEIVTVLEYLQSDKIPHGPISVAFTPDEEIGMGASHFDIKKFNADFAYTLDGGPEGEIQYENFNAAKAEFQINGVNVHPGSSKNIMVNASLVAMEINSLLPQNETPRDTDDYEGFFHLTDMKGDVGTASLHYIIRDHNAELFEKRKEKLRKIEKLMNTKWGSGTVTLTITEQYRNMAEIIADYMHLIDNAKKACIKAGISPLVLPIRGGTDGAQLSFMGLPCPNLGTGGYGYHGPYEHITVEGMAASCQIMLELIKIYAEHAQS